MAGPYNIGESTFPKLLVAVIPTNIQYAETEVVTKLLKARTELVFFIRVERNQTSDF